MQMTSQQPSLKENMAIGSHPWWEHLSFKHYVLGMILLFFVLGLLVVAWEGRSSSVVSSSMSGSVGTLVIPPLSVSSINDSTTPTEVDMDTLGTYLTSSIIIATIIGIGCVCYSRRWEW